MTTENADTMPGVMPYVAQIVTAYVGRNNVDGDKMPDVIRSVHAALMEVQSGKIAATLERPEPAVPVKKSVFHDYIICLEDGKKLKMLKRHLSSSYQMTPEAYRQRWQLPPDYPMVAPAYAETRSALAKKIGLGRKRADAEAAPRAERATSAKNTTNKGGGKRRGAAKK